MLNPESKQTITAEVPVASLLDDVISRQAAELANRYLPAMNIDQAVQRKQAVAKLKELVLVEGEDYGPIPGTDKPTLLKPGAEKICAFFGYVPEYEVLAGSIEDWKGEKFGEPLFYYHVKCTLQRSGSPVGQGTGSCSSWEKKYRYRNAGRTCTQCGGAFLIKGKAEYERDANYKRRGSWVCFEKKGGCGAKYYGDDPAIMGQQVGSVPNPDIADLINTVQKMADKRSYVAATLSATGASQWFTQDVEDMPTLEDAPTRQAEPQQRQAQQPPPQQRQEQPLQQTKQSNEPPPFAPIDDSDIPQSMGGTFDPGPTPSAEKHIDAMKERAAQPAPTAQAERPWSTFKSMVETFERIKADLNYRTGSDAIYYGELDLLDVKHANAFKSGEAAVKCYRALQAKLSNLAVKAQDGRAA